MVHIEKYKLTSGGAAYDLEIGFYPDTIELVNRTKFATDGTVVKSEWHRGMSGGYSLNEIADDTSINCSISTSDGFTIVSGSDIATNQSAISGITQASPAVVTVASTAAFTSGDVVRLHNVSGMTQVNGVDYKITVINSTTFSLQDMNGDNVDSSGYSAYVAAGDDYAVDLSVEIENEGAYKITLGTDVVGVSGDELYVTATMADTYKDLGDIS